MTDRLTVDQVLEEMRAARSRWETLLAEAGEARLTAPGVEGDWSIKDIVAHLAYFETWATDNVLAFCTGQPQPQAEYRGLTVDEENARLHERFKSKPLAQVLADSQASFQRSLEAVQGLRAENLYDPKFTGIPHADFTVFDLVEGDTFGHYNDHSTSVRAWLDRTGEPLQEGKAA